MQTSSTVTQNPKRTATSSASSNRTPELWMPEQTRGRTSRTKPQPDIHSGIGRGPGAGRMATGILTWTALPCRLCGTEASSFVAIPCTGTRTHTCAALWLEKRFPEQHRRLLELLRASLPYGFHDCALLVARYGRSIEEVWCIHDCMDPAGSKGLEVPPRDVLHQMFGTHADRCGDWVQGTFVCVEDPHDLEWLSLWDKVVNQERLGHSGRLFCALAAVSRYAGPSPISTGSDITTAGDVTVLLRFAAAGTWVRLDGRSPNGLSVSPCTGTRCARTAG